MSRLRLPESALGVIAWLGFVLMAASFVVLVLTPTPSLPGIVAYHKKAESFAVVVLDPGHGGQDSGAMAGNVLEKDLTLDIAQRIDRLLAAQGVATLLTRAGDSYVSLTDRAQLINRVNDAILISIHFDDGPGPRVSGVETYFAAYQTTGAPRIASWLPFVQRITNNQPNVESQSLAGFIQQQLVAHTQAINRGTKAEQFYVLANARHPAVLIEGGFLTNKDEIAKLTSANYREQLASAISDGILNYRETLKHRAPVLAEAVPTAE